MKERFRGFLPVIIDLETSGFNPNKNCILELAAVFLECNSHNKLAIDSIYSENILPFDGAIIDEASLNFLGIHDPYSALRLAVPEKGALIKLFDLIKEKLRIYNCTRAILTGHNVNFDLNFLHASIARHKLKSPFHQFSTFDTVSLAGAIFGETVLAKSVGVANITWDNSNAHGAIYDATKTAELFCHICNNYSKF